MAARIFAALALAAAFSPANASEQVGRVAGLSGPNQELELRRLLVAAQEGTADIREFYSDVFFHERQLRPTLLVLADDAHVGRMARILLTFVGEPADTSWLVRHPPKSNREPPFENRWAYYLATAVLEPADDAEWNFLRDCAFGAYHDGWVDFGAILTVRLIASPRSVKILEEARTRNPDRVKVLDCALAAIRSSPLALADRDIKEAARRVALAIDIGKWQGNEEPRFNQERDKALVDCVFQAGLDRLTYTATFHLVGERWKLRGVRETRQVLTAPPPPPRHR